MRRSRRNFLIGAGALVALAAAVTRSGGLHDWILDQIRMDFGDAVADSPETEAFIAGYVVQLREEHNPEYHEASTYFSLKPAYLTLMPGAELRLRTSLFTAFLRSTNIIRHLETGEAYMFVAIFDPEESPCANQLGAYAL